MRRIGSLFSGYGGLDMAVRSVIPGTSVAWHVEFDKAPSAVLAHHWPNVPNYGDIKEVDWRSVEPVEILTGGFPCQDLSHAGKRAGLHPGTRSGLWSHMAHAINELQPRLVVIENVLGILSAKASSDMEHCPLCMGDGAVSTMRALGAVCADLAQVGYDAQWPTVRASDDCGACHRRERVFIIAHPAGEPFDRSQPVSGHAFADTVRNLPTPNARDYKHAALSLSKHRPDAVDTLPRAIRKILLPTPTAGDGTKASSNPATSQRRIDKGQQPFLTDVVQTATDFGVYAPAVERWASVIGRPAPSPTEPGKYGPRLSPGFIEWMMGLPAGHVTDPAIGLSRAQAIRCLGNGVVPQQAAMALRQLLGLPTLPTLPTLRTLRTLPTPLIANNENRQSEGYGPNLGAALDELQTTNRK